MSRARVVLLFGLAAALSSPGDAQVTSITDHVEVGATGNGDPMVRAEADSGAPCVTAGDSDCSSSGSGLEMEYSHATTAARITAISRGTAYRAITLEGNGITISTGSGSVVAGLTVEADRDVVIENAGLVPNFVTADPCGTYPEGSLFYNDTSDYMCFCTGAGADVQLHAPLVACF